MHSTVRTSRCSASSSVGGRVCGVMTSSERRGPIVSASRTISQPPGTCHVVSSVLVPASYSREEGTLIPNGPSRKNPAARSSSVPKTLGASKLGTHSQSIAPSGATSALVWQSDRNAYSAMGGNGEGAAALCGAGWSFGVTALAMVAAFRGRSSECADRTTLVASSGRGDRA